MTLRFALTLALVLGALGLPGKIARSASAANTTELRIATLAPTGSSWMKVFDAWNRTVRKETNDGLRLRFYTGGSQGDERDFTRKMRAGQMDGAALTNIGLGQLVRPVVVLSVPGVLRDYDQLDQVRAKLGAHFERLFEQAGYKLLGWGDVGKTRLFSTARIENPADLRRQRPWAWKDDLIFTEFLKVVGANPVRLGVPEVYPALQTGMVDTLPASALAAVSLQWYTRLKYVAAKNSGIIVGAAVIRKDKFDALSEAQREILVDTGIRAHAALNKAVRRDDEKAYETILARGLTAVDTSEHQAEWDEVSKRVREGLVGRVYPEALLQEVIAAAEEQK